MSFETYIGRRYLKLGRKQAFISLITLLSIAGVTVGVMALIIVIAVMAGFESDLKSHILGGQSHIILKAKKAPFRDYAGIINDLKTIKGVEAATPFIYSQVMLKSATRVFGSVLRGVDPKTAGLVIETLKDIRLGGTTENADSGAKQKSYKKIVLGKELARRLNVGIGNPVYLITPRGMIAPVGHVPAMKRFIVTGFFESGMYEFDGSFAYIHLRDAQKMMRMSGAISGVEIKVRDIYIADEIADRIEDVLTAKYPDREFEARDWTEMNRNLFSALKLEKWAMFVILTLIVCVAAFNIAGSLIMMVMEKTKDIAVLKALGATDGSIKRIFVFKGMVVGLVGTGLGVVFGTLLCHLLKHYRIAEITGNIYYFTTNLPVRLQLIDVVLIVMASIIISFLATIYPAHQASRLDPVEAIRYG
jgi:lipoprotein-releasing system permease protein